MKKTVTKKTAPPQTHLYEPERVMLMIAVIAALSLVLLATFGL